MDDAALIDAIANGDDTALRLLFERHGAWLAARLRRTLPADAVEEVLQETFLAIWRGAGRYQAEGTEQREMVRMVYVEDRPLAEVAERLGIPQGTVKSRLFKARQRLRAALRGAED